MEAARTVLREPQDGNVPGLPDTGRMSPFECLRYIAVRVAGVLALRGAGAPGRDHCRGVQAEGDQAAADARRIVPGQLASFPAASLAVLY